MLQFTIKLHFFSRNRLLKYTIFFNFLFAIIFQIYKFFVIICQKSQFFKHWFAKIRNCFPRSFAKIHYFLSKFAIFSDSLSKFAILSNHLSNFTIFFRLFVKIYNLKKIQLLIIFCISNKHIHSIQIFHNLPLNDLLVQTINLLIMLVRKLCGLELFSSKSDPHTNWVSLFKRQFLVKTFQLVCKYMQFFSIFFKPQISLCC